MNNLKMRLGLIALLVCVGLPLTGAAQDTTDTSRATRTVTGCLQKGDHANEYHLIAEHAKWHLKSDNVSLSDHVGHKVKVDGAVSNASASPKCHPPRVARFFLAKAGTLSLQLTKHSLG
jgi:hypothetical protein